MYFLKKCAHLVCFDQEQTGENFDGFHSSMKSLVTHHFLGG